MITLSSKHKNIADRVFGRLKAVKPVEVRRLSSGRPRVYWLCECSCGNTKTVAAECLLYKGTKSCGCAIREHALRNTEKLTKHGLYKSHEYAAWQRMKRRCSDQSSNSYANYGGRGITVCDEWKRDFLSFLKEIGPRPSARHTVDRKDNNKGYEPGNVRWATRREQGNNRRTTHFVKINGEERSISEWCRHLQVVSRDVAFGRIRCGWEPLDALTVAHGDKKPTRRHEYQGETCLT